MSLNRPAIGQAIAGRRMFERQYPASLFVSFLGAADALLSIHQNLSFYSGLNSRPFDRDALLFRELTLTEDDPAIEIVLKPLLDELWQAAGLARCFDYDEEGVWKPHPYR